MVPADLVGIDVDVDDLLVGLGHREGEAGAHREDQVGLEQVIAHRRVRPDGGAERQVEWSLTAPLPSALVITPAWRYSASAVSALAGARRTPTPPPA